eukprot:gene8653-6080_t
MSYPPPFYPQPLHHPPDLPIILQLLHRLKNSTPTPTPTPTSMNREEQDIDIEQRCSLPDDVVGDVPEKNQDAVELSDADSGSMDENAFGNEVYKPKNPVARLCNTIVPHGGMLSSMYNLAAVTLGSGIIALPSAFQACGVITSILVLVAITAFTVYSVYILMLAVEKTNKRFYSYEALARGLLGRGWDYFAAFNMWIFCFGSCVSYVISTGDMLSRATDAPSVNSFLQSTAGNRVLSLVVWFVSVVPGGLVCRGCSRYERPAAVTLSRTPRCRSPASPAVVLVRRPLPYFFPVVYVCECDSLFLISLFVSFATFHKLFSPSLAHNVFSLFNYVVLPLPPLQRGQLPSGKLGDKPARWCKAVMVTQANRDRRGLRLRDDYSREEGLDKTNKLRYDTTRRPPPSFLFSHQDAAPRDWFLSSDPYCFQLPFPYLSTFIMNSDDYLSEEVPQRSSAAAYPDDVVGDVPEKNQDAVELSDADSGSMDENAFGNEVYKPKNPVARLCNTIVPHGGMLSSMYNLAAVTLGSGIIALPSAFQACGVITSILVLVAITAFTVYSVYILMLAVEKTNKRFYSYEALARGLLGRGWDYFAAFNMWIFCFGSCVSYVISTGDMLSRATDAPSVNSFLQSTAGNRVLVIACGLVRIRRAGWFGMPGMFPLRAASSSDSIAHATLSLSGLTSSRVSAAPPSLFLSLFSPSLAHNVFSLFNYVVLPLPPLQRGQLPSGKLGDKPARWCKAVMVTQANRDRRGLRLRDDYSREEGLDKTNKLRYDTTRRPPPSFLFSHQDAGLVFVVRSVLLSTSLSLIFQQSCLDPACFNFIMNSDDYLSEEVPQRSSAAAYPDDVVGDVPEKNQDAVELSDADSGSMDENAFGNEVYKPKNPVARLCNTIVPHGGMLSSMYNLAAVTLGSGIIALPSAFQACGVITSILVLVAITAFTVYSVYILMLAVEKTNKRFYSYEALARGLLGRGWDYCRVQYVDLLLRLLCLVRHLDRGHAQPRHRRPLRQLLPAVHGGQPLACGLVRIRRAGWFGMPGMFPLRAASSSDSIAHATLSLSGLTSSRLFSPSLAHNVFSLFNYVVLPLPPLQRGQLPSGKLGDKPARWCKAVMVTQANRDRRGLRLRDDYSREEGLDKTNKLRYDTTRRPPPSFLFSHQDAGLVFVVRSVLLSTSLSLIFQQSCLDPACFNFIMNSDDYLSEEVPQRSSAAAYPDDVVGDVPEKNQDAVELSDADSGSMDENAFGNEVYKPKNPVARLCNTIVPHGGMLSSMYNLAAVTLGSGIIALPSAFQACGVITSILVLVAITAFTVYSVYILMLAVEKTNKRFYSYEALARGLLGRGWDYCRVQYVDLLLRLLCLVRHLDRGHAQPRHRRPLRQLLPAVHGGQPRAGDVRMEKIMLYIHAMNVSCWLCSRDFFSLFCLFVIFILSFLMSYLVDGEMPGMGIFFAVVEV